MCNICEYHKLQNKWWKSHGTLKQINHIENRTFIVCCLNVSVIPDTLVNLRELMRDNTDINVNLSPNLTHMDHLDTKVSVLHEIDTKTNIENEQCSICLINKRCILLKPCKHTGTCQECTSKIKKCPICRTIITSKEHIYL